MAGGGADSAVAVFVRNIVEREVQLWGDVATRIAEAEHHGVGLFLSAYNVVPVVLLVRAVEFKNLNARFGEVGGVLL